MKIFKFIISWQFLVSIILVIAISFGFLQGMFLWINNYTNHGVQVEVPNLNNLNLEQAIAKLDSSNLEYEIDTSKYDPKYKSYQILDIYPFMGSNVKKGRRIFIRANAKTWKPVTVPNIIGKYKYLAYNQLDLVGLKVTDTIYEPSLAVNTVLKILYKGKEVQPGVTLPRLSPLTIVLGKGLAKNVLVPSFIGLDETTAKGMITENLFSVGSIIYDDPDNKANTRVYYQVPSPSSIYDQGQAVDLYLSSKPLEELRDKIRNLDATFNKRFINKSDSLYINTPIPEADDNSVGSGVGSQNNTNTSGNNTPKREVSSPRTQPIKEEHKNPVKVIIE